MVIAGQVTPVDRLVMRDPVPEEVETLDTILHVSSDPIGVIRQWVLSKRGAKGRYPQRSQVPGAAQESPEPESEFGDDLAVHLGLSSLGCALAGIGYYGPGLGRLSTKEMLLPVPGILPPLSQAMSDERIVHSVAEENLKTAEILVERGACPDVPIVQVDGVRDAAVGHLEVRTEPFPGEAIGDRRVVDA
ncbi:MAG: hypothetical protein J4G11_05300 [Acidimicrobiia bacterium]|nr:hypothetical protein [Acidimicrobiia bacterium]